MTAREKEQKEYASLLAELRTLRSAMIANAAGHSYDFQRLYPSYLESAQNLLHYLALRGRDLRTLQIRLSRLGLSSLGRAEPNALANVDAVIATLRVLSGEHHSRSISNVSLGAEALERHTEQLLGPSPRHRSVRIIVTLPSEAADDPRIVADLLAGGMDCARINCAHDDESAWSHMVKHLRAAQAALGKHCRLIMDLAGPKLRTGEVAPGPPVVRVRPTRDVFGRVLQPGRMEFVAVGDDIESARSSESAVVPVSAHWLKGMTIGDRIALRDARGRSRTLTIVSVDDTRCVAHCERTLYLTPGLMLHKLAKSENIKGDDSSTVTPVGKLPTTDRRLRLMAGELLRLTRRLLPGGPAVCDPSGLVVSPAHISCTLPGIFTDVKVDERVWFDDGKLGGVIEAVTSETIDVRIVHSGSRGSWLGEDKGINLPDSALQLPALTDKDREDLRFVARHADAVALSFVQDANDVQELERELAKLGAEQVGIVLKIETRRAVQQLPKLLIASMVSPCDGVMIARGDLAIQCGYERLAELQEEILCVCEAAHIPVIWATQVLETLTKEGQPTRAEISDAGLATRSEGVLLNKGLHVRRAVRALDSILSGMEPYHRKKRSLLCELSLVGKSEWPDDYNADRAEHTSNE